MSHKFLKNVKKKAADTKSPFTESFKAPASKAVFSGLD